MRIIRFLPICVVLVTGLLWLAAPAVAHAASLYWVGASGANFSTASNWKTTDPTGCGSGDSGAAPGASDVAIFDADCDNDASMDTTVNVLGIDLKSGYIGSVSPASAISIAIGTSGFVQAGGTFTATSGTLTITDGPITRSGGTFTHNSGTVAIASTSTAGITLTANNASFYNLTIEKTTPASGSSTLTFADSFTVANDVTIQNNDSTATLLILAAINVGPTITIGDDLLFPSTSAPGVVTFGTSSASTNFTVNLGGDFTLADASTTVHSNITFNGSSDQALTNSAGSVASGTWTGSKSAGNVTLAASLDITANFSISSNTFNISDTDNFRLNGTFTQSGGTFGSTAGIFTVENTFNRTSGTFTHNSGTLRLRSDVNSFTVTTNGATFYNLTLDKTILGSSSTTITLADSFTVANDLSSQNDTSANTLTVIASSGVGPTVTVQGDFSFPTTGSPSALTFGASSALTNFTVNLEGDYSQVDTSVVMWATLVMTGSNTHTWSKTGGTFNSDFKVNKSGGEARLATAMATATSSQDVIVEEGTFDISSFNLTVNNTSSTLIVQDGGVLQLQGDETITANIGYPSLLYGSTVTYDGTSGPYTIKDYTYHHLRFNGSGGTFNLGATESTAGNTTISAGTFDISGFSLAVTGTFSNDDTFRLQGGETTVSLTMDTDSGTTVYDGTTSYTGLKAGSNYYNLTFNGSGGSWTLGAALDVNGALTLTTGTLDVSTSNYGIQVAGNWTNNATFTPRSGTVTLDGTSQTLAGATTFYKLTKNVTSAATLTLPASVTQTVSNTLTLGGASGALLSLRSSTGGTQALLDPQGTRTVSYLDVKDNWNTNATAVACSTGCVDSGNNTNWNFSSTNEAPAATTPSSITQATTGTGVLTFKTTLSDANLDVTRLKIEYATNLGDWEDPTISNVTSSRGSVTRNNNDTYQLSSIDTDGGSVELTITWTTKSQLTNIEDASVYLRLIPNDGTADGSAVISAAFTVDNKAPATSKITLDDRTATSLTPKWVPGSTDISWQYYTLCYGTNATDVNNCNIRARVWTQSNDPALTTQSTNTTTITGLTTGASYRILLRGHDTKGNVSKLLSAAFIPLAEPLTPVLAASDIRDTTVALYWNRIQDDAFIRSELCYSKTYARVLGTTCDTTTNPNPAIKKTFTSPTVLSDILTGLQTSTRYYVRLFVFYTGFATQRTGVLIVTTCPAGQYRVNNVCMDISHPSPTPTPSPRPSPYPSPTPSPSPEATPTPTPESTATPPPPSDVPSPSPSPDGGAIGTVTETIQNVVETITEAITAIVETIVAATQEAIAVIVQAVQKVVALARAIISSPSLGIAQAQAALKPIVEQPAVKVATAVATAAAVVSVAAQASIITSAAPSALSQLPQIFERLWQGILGIFGFRRKKRPWGRVVDASTGDALAGAYVQVFDHQTKKLQNTMTTNAQGAFSSLVPPGMYEFRVHKPGWTLTPQASLMRLVAGERIYDGKPVAVTEEKVLPLVLALRLTEAIPLTHHLVWRKTVQTIELFVARLSWPLLVLGAVLNSAVVFASSTPINIGIELFYVLLIGWKLRLRFKQRPAIGVVRDTITNRPLDLALVRLYDAATGKLLETRTTSAEGKFLLLPSPGVYTISVVREGYAPYREAHVVVSPQREALALAFSLQPNPIGQLGLAMNPPTAPAQMG